MVATAVGMSVRGFVPFAATFAAFLARAYDFIRMSAISRANIRLCGSHAGVSIGEDGPSQMALEDLAMMRSVGGSTVLYPCDANQTAKLVAEMADQSGVVYHAHDPRGDPGDLRRRRSVPDRRQQSRSNSRAATRVTIVAAGITLVEALAAHEELAKAGVVARVIDAYSVKPIDVATLRRAAAETRRHRRGRGPLARGQAGAAVLEGLASTGESVPPVRLLGVTKIPGSGTPAELMDACGISARHIVEAARAIAR